MRTSARFSEKLYTVSQPRYTVWSWLSCRIQSHVAALTEWTYGALAQLSHGNGAPIMKVFGKHHLFSHRQVRPAAHLPTYVCGTFSLFSSHTLCASCQVPKAVSTAVRLAVYPSLRTVKLHATRN